MLVGDNLVHNSKLMQEEVALQHGELSNYGSSLLNDAPLPNHYKGLLPLYCRTLIITM